MTLANALNTYFGSAMVVILIITDCYKYKESRWETTGVKEENNV